MTQFWENLVRDRQTDRQKDESDFIGRCPTDIDLFIYLFIYLFTYLFIYFSYLQSTKRIVHRLIYIY